MTERDRAKMIQQCEDSLRADGHGTFLDGPQVAAILRCSVSCLHAWRRRGDIEAVYPVGSGRPLLFTRREIARYVTDAAVMRE